MVDGYVVSRDNCVYKLCSWQFPQFPISTFADRIIVRKSDVVFDVISWLMQLLMLPIGDIFRVCLSLCDVQVDGLFSIFALLVCIGGLVNRFLETLKSSPRSIPKIERVQDHQMQNHNNPQATKKSTTTTTSTLTRALNKEFSCQKIFRRIY